MHFPHPINKKLKKISRLVILPDYQGIGIGTKFLNEVAKMYHDKNFDVGISTSAKNLIYSLQKNKNWVFVNYNYSIYNKNNKNTLKKTARNKTKIASFYFKKGDE